jgi:gas vesicle protein
LTPINIAVQYAKAADRGIELAHKEIMMSQRNDDVMFFAGLVLGAIAGGAMAALLTPQSGPETREQVVERGLELKNRAEDAVQRAQQVASEAVAKVQTSAQDLIKRPGDDVVRGGEGI